jgi:putative glutamine amidotransferase
MHHQAIKTLATGLRPSAHAPDGVIEAIESGTDHYLLGVQWHPEVFEQTDERTQRLFGGFVSAASQAGS